MARAPLGSPPPTSPPLLAPHARADARAHTNTDAHAHTHTLRYRAQLVERSSLVIPDALALDLTALRP